MAWDVDFHPEFAAEFVALADAVKEEILALANALSAFGPKLGRPRVDTLSGSRHANMKELRFNAGDGVWRVAFAFDPKRRGILLVAGDKSGMSSRMFYRRLIATADRRYGNHLSGLENGG